MIRELLSAVVVVSVAALIAVWLSAESRAQTKPSLVGAWTLNKDLSDRPPDRDERTGGNAGGRAGGSGGRRGGFGRRGMGGGGRGPDIDREAIGRRREAMRDIMEPPDHLTVTQTESMILITDGEGRTTRLSTDGQKIKDDNTGIERKTRWEGDKLVSEISGAGPGKITQSYTVDPAGHQLRITAIVEGGRGGGVRTITHVYDATP
jgi:hypothetical protein